jgi:hypothetical protein
MTQPDHFGAAPYRISIHFTQFTPPGTYRIRARIAAGQGHSEGISEEITITLT